MHDAFRLIDADGDMHITPTDLRDIKTWAADDGSTDFLDKLIFQVYIICIYEYMHIIYM